MRTKSEKNKTKTREKTRESVSDNSRFFFSFESDWLREWREVSGPITWIRKEKSMQQSVNFINKFKITLMIITAIIHGDRLR